MATSPAPVVNGAVSDLLLRVTPPRVARDLLVRPRLASGDAQFRDKPAIVVQAPAGFGKTSLLAQWRREHLAHGAIVAWLTANGRDDPQGFLQGLTLSVRMASGRPTFGHTLVASTPAGLDGITAWLAEVSHSTLDVVLFIDEADRLPASTREALTYLLNNAPPNLRVIVAARADCDVGVDDLVLYGKCVIVGVAMLRFRLEETIALARARFGHRLDADDCARLHEAAEGWPLGVQIAMAAAARGADFDTAIGTAAIRAGGLHEQFGRVMLSNLEPGDAPFLTRVSVADDLHPDLCRALTGDSASAERTARLMRETPILVAAEGSDWFRMHALARDVLRARFEALAEPEKSELHSIASRWLAEQGMLEAAARHALAAGRREEAFDLAERCLYEGLMRQGHVGAVLDWLAQMPDAELDRRPRLLLAAAWALAVSGRYQEAERRVTRILVKAGGDAPLRCECALILSGAAGFADDPDRFAELHDPWAEAPPLTDPLLLYVHANRRAFRALFGGDPAQARRYQQQAPRGEFGNAFGYVARWGDFINGLSYLWEGQVSLTESLLRPSLAIAEGDLGRRDPFVCMLAAVLAAAVWERDRPDEAAALLANRLDVLERSGLPEAVLLGYRTAARIAAAAGAENRALELLEAMHAAGLARDLPRLCIASLAEQVRVHARRFRPESCRALCARIDEILGRDDLGRGRLWRRSVEWLQMLAHANAAIAAQDWRGALEPLARVGELAAALKLGRVRIEVMALRAFVLDRCGERATALLQEAIDLANTYGLARLFVDAHPALGDWAQRVTAEPPAAGRGGGQLRDPARSLAAPMQAPRPAEATVPRVAPSMALTPKEREVLELLARNLSNKEIALAMEIGEATIKWHMKNLFVKLAVGTRKQVVRRAQLLGLLDQPS